MAVALESANLGAMAHYTNYDLNALPIFVKVAELRSFSAAARALARPKSTVSRNISLLEDALGITLIKRTSRQVELTEAGEAFYRHCLTILSNLEQAEDAVNAHRDSPRGLLQVQMPFTFGHYVLGPALASFLEMYAEIDLKVHLSSQMLGTLNEGIDVAIHIGPVPESGLIARRLGVSHLSWYASPQYLASHDPPTSLADLGNHTIIAYRNPAGGHPMRVDHGDWIEELDLKVRASVSEPSAVRDLVVGGAGLGYMPQLLCTRAVEAGQLVPLLPEVESPPVDIVALYPRHRSSSPKVRAFVDFLIKHRRSIEEGKRASSQ